MYSSQNQKNVKVKNKKLKSDDEEKTLDEETSTYYIEL
jgi:hypothetical protein